VKTYELVIRQRRSESAIQRRSESVGSAPLGVDVAFETETLRGIRCLRCGRTSWNRSDVEERYCGFCNLYHYDTNEPVAEQPLNFGLVEVASSALLTRFQRAMEERMFAAFGIPNFSRIGLFQSTATAPTAPEAPLDRSRTMPSFRFGGGLRDRVVPMIGFPSWQRDATGRRALWDRMKVQDERAKPPRIKASEWIAPEVRSAPGIL
jgi:hypothetical protein